MVTRGSDLEFRVERAKQLKRALLNKRWTQVQLAEKSGYDEKTIRNVLRGDPVRDQTIVDISNALEVDPRLDNTLGEVDIADDDFGGYLRSTHRGYEGYFHAFRRGFSDPDKIFRSPYFIEWSPHTNRFHFQEYYQADDDEPHGAKAHSGIVYMSSYTSLVHFVTVYEGSIRLVTLTKMRESAWLMRGTIQTQIENMMFFQPTVGPIVLQKLKDYDPADRLAADIGYLTQDDPTYASALEQIEITERQIVKVSFNSKK